MKSAKIEIEIFNSKIIITKSSSVELYFIQKYKNRFYVTSNNGYNGFDGEGHKTIDSAIASAKRLIKCN